MRALRSRRRRVLTSPQSSWDSETGDDKAYDSPWRRLRIHVTTLIALNEGTSSRVGEVGTRPKFFLVMVLIDDSRWRTQLHLSPSSAFYPRVFFRCRIH